MHVQRNTLKKIMSCIFQAPENQIVYPLERFDKTGLRLVPYSAHAMHRESTLFDGFVGVLLGSAFILNDRSLVLTLSIYYL